jgi:hypothetical protein
MSVCACLYPTILHQPADPRSLPSKRHASIGQSTSNPYSLFNLISSARQAGHAGRRGGARNTKLWPEIQRFVGKTKMWSKIKILIGNTRFSSEIRSFVRKYKDVKGNTKLWSEIYRCDRKQLKKRYHSEYLQERMLKWILKQYDGRNSIHTTYNKWLIFVPQKL